MSYHFRGHCARILRQISLTVHRDRIRNLRRCGNRRNIVGEGALL